MTYCSRVTATSSLEMVAATLSLTSAPRRFIAAASIMADFADIAMVATDIVLYFRNTALDRARDRGEAAA